MNIIEKLKDKYSKQLEKSKYPRDKNDFNPTIFLFQKWAYKSAGKGWYMIDLNGAPFVWALIINEFLEWLDKQCPDFVIQQIKIKFSELRFYVKYGHKEIISMKKREMVDKNITDLESWLTDIRLMY